MTGFFFRLKLKGSCGLRVQPAPAMAQDWFVEGTTKWMSGVSWVTTAEIESRLVRFPKKKSGRLKEGVYDRILLDPENVKSTETNQ